MSGLEEVVAANRRLAALRVLREAGGTGNASVLTEALRSLGHARTTREEVKSDLRFFEAAGLVTIEWFNDTLAVATLTERGLDVVSGRSYVAGIKRPEIVG